ncbi:MAG: hypothetical protein V1789_00320 [PVC group bacterium]
MRKNVFVWKVLLVLLVFSPPAFLPSPLRAALLSSRSRPAADNSEIVQTRALDYLKGQGISRERAEEILGGLSPREVGLLALTPVAVHSGGADAGIRESLMSNETAAIVITLIMLAVIVGGVEISRH